MHVNLEQKKIYYNIIDINKDKVSESQRFGYKLMHRSKKLMHLLICKGRLSLPYKSNFVSILTKTSINNLSNLLFLALE